MNFNKNTLPLFLIINTEISFGFQFNIQQIYSVFNYLASPANMFIGIVAKKGKSLSIITNFNG